MTDRRFRPLLYAVAALAVVWLFVWAGSSIARNSRMTAAKLKKYSQSLDFSHMSAEERARALRAYADRLNALSLAERQKWRRDGEWKDLFPSLTEKEREMFVEATLPTGLKQAMDSFAKLPDVRRKKMIDDALKAIRENPDAPVTANPDGSASASTNAVPISPELEKKVRAVGLGTFYTQSSAETKAELAPLLEEVQRQIKTRGPRFNQ